VSGEEQDAELRPGESRRARRKARARARTPGQRWRRRILGGLAALLIAIAAAGGGLWWYLNYRIGQAKHVVIPKAVLHHAKPGKPFNVLLIGSDTRSFEKNNAQAGKFGSSSSVTGQRSDVIIIARIVPATRQIYMLSIPRDTWVTIPGHVPYVSGQNRINAAFNKGPTLLIKTLKKDFGIPVDHFAEVNFAGFQGMVQAVGGIRINFPDPIKDAYTGLSIRHTGCQLISGGMSLAFVRSRHLYYEQNGQWLADYGSDWSRIRRQDIFFHALLDQVRSKVLDPFAMNSLLTAVVHNITIDSTLSSSFLLRLAFDFRHANTTSIHTEVLPTIPYVTSAGADVLLPATTYDHQMIAKFLAIGTKPAKAPHNSSSGSSPTTTAPAAPTTTTPSNVVFDTQPEPWNGTPC
jgi:LCP family protein required for cell wall assembly